MTFDKIQDGGGCCFEIQFTDHTLVATAHIRTKFAARTKNNVPDTILPSDFTFEKSKTAATAILNLCNGYNSVAR